MAEAPYAGIPYTNYLNRRAPTSVYIIDADGMKSNFTAFADGTAIENEKITTRMLSTEVKDLIAFGISGVVETYGDLPDPAGETLQTIYAVKTSDGLDPAGLWMVLDASGVQYWDYILRAVSNHAELDNRDFNSAGHTGFQKGTWMIDSAPTADDDIADTAGNGIMAVGDLWCDTAALRVYICTDSTAENAVWKSIDPFHDRLIQTGGFEPPLIDWIGTGALVVAGGSPVVATFTPAVSPAWTIDAEIGKVIRLGTDYSNEFWEVTDNTATALTLERATTAQTDDDYHGKLQNTAGHTLSYVSATRVLTIAPKVAGIPYYIWDEGKRYEIDAAKTITLPDVDGQLYVKFTADALEYVLPANIDFSFCLVAVAYLNSAEAEGIVHDEAHGCVMDSKTHEYLHRTDGARYGIGLAPTFATGSLSIADGIIWDEDIKVVIPTQTTARALFKDGSAVWDWADTTVPFYAVSNKLQWNDGTTLTDATAGRYIAYWVFGTPDIGRPIVIVIGQRQDTTLANARVNNSLANLSLTDLPSPEYKLLFRVIARQVGASNPTYQEFQDLRNVPFRLTDNAPVYEGKPDFLVKFSPYAFREPATGSAEVAIATVGALEKEVIAFDDTDAEYVYGETTTPGDLGANLSFIIEYNAESNGTSKEVRFKVEVWDYLETTPVALTTADLVPQTYTAGVDEVELTSTLTALGLTAGQSFSFRVSIVAPADGDRVVGDTYMQSLKITGARV
jgi:hypothetical protein